MKKHVAMAVLVGAMGSNAFANDQEVTLPIAAKELLDEVNAGLEACSKASNSPLEEAGCREDAMAYRKDVAEAFDLSQQVLDLSTPSLQPEPNPAVVAEVVDQPEIVQTPVLSEADLYITFSAKR